MTKKKKEEPEQPPAPHKPTYEEVQQIVAQRVLKENEAKAEARKALAEAINKVRCPRCHGEGFNEAHMRDRNTADERYFCFNCGLDVYGHEVDALAEQTKVWNENKAKAMAEKVERSKRIMEAMLGGPPAPKKPTKPKGSGKKSKGD